MPSRFAARPKARDWRSGLRMNRGTDAEVKVRTVGGRPAADHHARHLPPGLVVQDQQGAEGVRRSQGYDLGQNPTWSALFPGGIIVIRPVTDWPAPSAHRPSSSAARPVNGWIALLLYISLAGHVALLVSLNHLWERAAASGHEARRLDPTAAAPARQRRRRMPRRSTEARLGRQEARDLVGVGLERRRGLLGRPCRGARSSPCRRRASRSRRRGRSTRAKGRKMPLFVTSIVCGPRIVLARGPAEQQRVEGAEQARRRHTAPAARAWRGRRGRPRARSSSEAIALARRGRRAAAGPPSVARSRSSAGPWPTR